jgi:glycine/D-amino acid oxidase-like deaminating enzyme
MFYPEANRAAVERIRTWVEVLGIACDYERKAAYAYTCDPKRVDDIRQEAEAARILAFGAQVLDRAPLPFPTAGALCFPDQAQFNPVSYLVALANAVEARGGRIFEQSRAKSFDQDNGWRRNRAGDGEGRAGCCSHQHDREEPGRLCQPHAAPQPCGHGVPA